MARKIKLEKIETISKEIEELQEQHKQLLKTTLKGLQRAGTESTD